MKKLIASVAFTIMAVLGMGSAVALQTVPAVASGRSQAQEYIDATKGDNEDDLMPRVQVIINVVLGVLGLIAVVMIIVGGVMYTTSQGNPEAVTKAKNVILYSIIGLVVALLGFAIVNFVLANVFDK